MVLTNMTRKNAGCTSASGTSMESFSRCHRPQADGNLPFWRIAVVIVGRLVTTIPASTSSATWQSMPQEPSTPLKTLIRTPIITAASLSCWHPATKRYFPTGAMAFRIWSWTGLGAFMVQPAPAEAPWARSGNSRPDGSYEYLRRPASWIGCRPFLDESSALGALVLLLHVLFQLALFLQRHQVVEQRILRRRIELLDRTVGAQGQIG